MKITYGEPTDMWPPDDPELAAAIGRLVIAWGMMETEIDYTIADLYRLHDDLDLADCLTANLGTKAKLEIVQSCAHCLSGWIAPVNVKDIDTLVSDTAKASNDHRNFVAHGRPSYVDTGGAEDLWIWARPSARKGGPKLRIVHFHPDYFKTATADITALVKRWDKLRADMEPGLKALDLGRRG